MNLGIYLFLWKLCIVRIQWAQPTSSPPNRSHNIVDRLKLKGEKRPNINACRGDCGPLTIDRRNCSGFGVLGEGANRNVGEADGFMDKEGPGLFRNVCLRKKKKSNKSTNVKKIIPTPSSKTHISRTRNRYRVLATSFMVCKCCRARFSW